ncbi:helix-turn-helix domain-containing protein [Paracoccus sp. (in: a-proteobacteria)]|uniref:helix-turn-helix domain-containing protein n=1 Tax=Paracoccus sp. TaxID=267 RepID=UPI0034CEEAAE
MPAPLPKELRDRFARLIEEGLSGRKASRLLQVSAATGARWRRQIHASGAAQIARMGVHGAAASWRRMSSSSESWWPRTLT